MMDSLFTQVCSALDSGAASTVVQLVIMIVNVTRSSADPAVCSECRYNKHDSVVTLLTVECQHTLYTDTVLLYPGPGPVLLLAVAGGGLNSFEATTTLASQLTQAVMTRHWSA